MKDRIASLFGGEWRTVAGETQYFICEDGRVASLIHRPRILKGGKAGLGYRKICFASRPHRYVHQIACEAFHGPRGKGQQVRHLNGNRTDNRASNLAWGSAAENAADKILHGTDTNGEKNPMARLTVSAVEKMRAIRAETGASHKIIAKQFGVSTMTAFRAVEYRSWK